MIENNFAEEQEATWLVGEEPRDMLVSACSVTSGSVFGGEKEDTNSERDWSWVPVFLAGDRGEATSFLGDAFSGGH